MTSMMTNVSTYTGSMIASARRLFRRFGPGIVTGVAADAAHSRARGNPKELFSLAVTDWVLAFALCAAAFAKLALRGAD